MTFRSLLIGLRSGGVFAERCSCSREKIRPQMAPTGPACHRAGPFRKDAYSHPFRNSSEHTSWWLWVTLFQILKSHTVNNAPFSSRTKGGLSSKLPPPALELLAMGWMPMPPRTRAVPPVPLSLILQRPGPLDAPYLPTVPLGIVFRPPPTPVPGPRVP